MYEPPYRLKNMMPGMIMLWYGTYATIPSGWALCDGTQGTPDLYGLFIRGSGNDGTFFHPLHEGGAENHAHPFTGDGHSHDLQSGTDIDVVYPDGDVKHQSTVSPAVGDTDAIQHIPPYMCLAYIMKLPIP